MMSRTPSTITAYSTVDETPVLVPDEVTGDITFRVYTPNADVKSMVLQYRKAGDWYADLGNWRDVKLGDASLYLDFEPQLARTVGGTTYYYWW